MEIENEITKQRELQSLILKFIESDDDDDNNYFQALKKFFVTNNISKNNKNLEDLFHLILVISDNHHRESNFFEKIMEIFIFINNDIQLFFSDLDICKFFMTNRLLIYYLIQNKIIIPSQECINYIFTYSLRLSLTQSYKLQSYKLQYKFFLYPVIKSYIDKKKQKEIERNITKLIKMDLTEFQQNCQNGENDSIICKLIRKDSINEFITYVNQMNIPLRTEIKESIFETNSFLICKRPSLIEYAAFFGSVKIFKYLTMNKIKIKQTLWKYAIHGRNSEIIHLIEESIFNQKVSYYEKLLRESIICHHNEIANYIEQNYILYDEENKLNNFSVCLKYHNYMFLPIDFITILSIPRKIRIKTNEFGIYKLFMSLEKITIPSTVTEINEYIFCDFKSLKEVVISSSVNSIKRSSFENCSSLSKVLFDGSSKLAVIEGCAFKNCESLVEISLPSSVTTISSHLFEGCSSLSQILIPSSVTKIDSYAFKGCKSLTQILIPSSVTKIDSYAFNECKSLTRIEIPSSVTFIGGFAFSFCVSLESITIPSSVKSIERGTFSCCSSLVHVMIPNSVKIIDECAFRRCKSLVQIDIPSSVEKIDEFAFNGCVSLKKIEIPSSVIFIGKHSFEGCTSLLKILFDNSTSLELIDDFTFKDCSSLAEIMLPSSLKLIGEHSFECCSSLTKISIPSSVKEIGSFCFLGCSSLHEITVPSSVKEIKAGVFKECLSLTQISIPSSVSKIGYGSFRGCKSLKQISIPSSVTEICNYSFYGCTSLEKIAISSSLTKIGEYSFYGCNLLLSQSSFSYPVKTTKIEKETKKINDNDDDDSIQNYIHNKKELYKAVLDYIEAVDEVDNYFDILIHIFDDQKISENEFDLLEFLNFLTIISENHNRSTNIIEKVEKIITIFREEMKQFFSNNTIFHIFENNKRILLFLFKEEILTIDKSIINTLTGNKYSKFKYKEYFEPEINHFFTSFYSFDPGSHIKYTKEFEENRKIGENHNFICQIIRNDSIDDFTFYLKTKNLNKKFLNSFKIPSSEFETNSLLLLNGSIALIEYAAFYGSFKIFNFLYNNGVKLTTSLWTYVIHSNKLEIIKILEVNGIKPKDSIGFYLKMNKYMYEAIKCHHNNIIQYLQKNYKLQIEPKLILEFLNYSLFDEIEINGELLMLLLSSTFNFPKLIQVLLKNKKIFDLKKIIVSSIKSNDINTLKFVLNRFESEIKIDEDLIYKVIYNENEEMLNLLLLNSDVNINAVLAVNFVHNEQNYENVSFLFLTILKYNINMMKILLKHPDIDVNLPVCVNGNKSYLTALHLAILENRIQCVEILLKHQKIDVNFVAIFNEKTYKFSNKKHFDLFLTPLHESIVLKRYEILRLLMNHSDILVNKYELHLFYTDFFKKSCIIIKQTALSEAIQMNDVELVSILLDHQDINIDQISFCIDNREHIDKNNGYNIIQCTALHFACAVQNPEIIQLLLDRRDAK